MMIRFQNIIFAVFFIMIPVVSLADNTMPLHEIQVRFDPEHHSVIGESRITLPPGKDWTIQTGGIAVTSVSVSGAAYREDAKAGTITVEAGTGPRVASIVFT